MFSAGSMIRIATAPALARTRARATRARVPGQKQKAAHVGGLFGFRVAVRAGRYAPCGAITPRTRSIAMTWLHVW